jgi:acetylglutamate kinase
VADETFLGIIHDLNLLHSLGVHLVVIHGSRPQIEAILAQQGIESRYAFGLRITDAETMDCVPRALGPGALAHRGAALARHREFADGRRSHSRVLAATSSRRSRWVSSTASTCS